MAYDDYDADDDLDDDYDVDDYDVEDSADEDALIPCPHCGEELPEDAVHCPYCGEYITSEEYSRAARPWWLWPVVIVLVISLLAAWGLVL